MTANDRDRNSRPDTTLDPRSRRELVHAYVDGTLDEKSALHLHLRARSDADLAREIEEARAFFGALDGLAREEAPEGFDARILATVPLERYRSAPRRRPTVLVLGDLAPAAWVRALRRAGRGAIAATVAYGLVLLVGRSALHGAVTSASASVHATLDSWAQAASTVPVLAPVADGLARAYGAVSEIGAAFAAAVGPGAAVVLVGTLLAVGALATITAKQRRSLESSRH